MLTGDVHLLYLSTLENLRRDAAFYGLDGLTTRVTEEKVRVSSLYEETQPKRKPTLSSGQTQAQAPVPVYIRRYRDGD
jgi:hypothetical protein